MEIDATKPLDLSTNQVPDIMNDPEYDTNAVGGADGAGEGDIDTCRICRGEGTEKEPLFYPCKCSGSIKFVHQDCLLEWLSHSQKKHCELCKTPFRFTKLYSPNMPPELPFYVFMKHLIVHTLQNVATWLRFCLVVLVWLVCLPWAMRHVWTFLFWFGDGGWTYKQMDFNVSQHTAAMQALTLAQERLASLAANGTSPANPFLANPTTSASMWRMLQKLPNFLKPVSQTLNMSSSDPLASNFFKTIVHGLGFRGVTSTYEPASTPNISGLPITNIQNLDLLDRASLLSDSKFLKSLTRNPRVNNIIITTLEGQIITIVVVVCFVLVFLIREWVVQQQPGINMGAGFNAEFAAVDRADRNRIAAPENMPDPDGFPLNATNVNDRQDTGAAEVADIDTRPLDPVDVPARPIARPRRRIVHFDDAQAHDSDTPSPAALDKTPSFDHYGEKVGESSHNISQTTRPGIPMRDALSPAVEVQRRLVEDSSSNQGQIGAGEFVSVWRRAEGDPDEILRIMEAEGLGEKLRYWKNAMATLQHAKSAPITSGVDRIIVEAEKSQHSEIVHTAPHTNDGSERDDSEVNDAINNEIQSGLDQVSQALGYEGSDISSLDKGKQKAVEGASETLFDPNMDLLPGLGSTSTSKPAINVNSSREYLIAEGDIAADPKMVGRPRAISDGPPLRESISPLANNNWIFSDIPVTPVKFGSSNSIADAPRDQSWKASQDFRVQQAVLKAREAQTPRQSISPTTSSVNSSNTKDSDAQGPIIVQKSDQTIVADSWDEVFAQNPISDSEGDWEEVVPSRDLAEDNPFRPDTDLPANTPLVAGHDIEPNARNEPQGIWGYITDWLWGDMEPRQEGLADDDEHIVEDIAAEAPFVPVPPHHGHGLFANGDNDGIQEVAQDQQVADAAIAAGLDPNDPEGLDDIEDFDGIMELVGMRGPLTGLIQNGLFSAVLISLTVACGVWIPYNLGRLTLLLVAYPIKAIKLPLKLVFGGAVVLQDLTLMVIGGLACLIVEIFSVPRYLYLYGTSGPELWSYASRPRLAIDCMKMAYAAGTRITNGFIGTLVQIPESEVPAFSAVSHEALLHIKSTIRDTCEMVGAFITSRLMRQDGGRIFMEALANLSSLWTKAIALIGGGVEGWSALSARLGNPSIWVISLDLPARDSPLDLNLSYWSGTDRFWAILAGYIAFSLLGAAYLKRGTPFSSGQNAREWEAMVIDILNQAGGVMKVILIISIEMLVFPLYCGLLLDIALLPLFENATLISRVHFTLDSPLTSIFVHWFVGTCYMFHFALFVSMCRKIMRSGVLYFIRDPDDPTFHPVRDVLERNVGTQLRKITFSAMVYGALVILCLGGVVWTLAFAFDSVLPIHWSSNEPVLEFPIDLLFYNFFMPLAVKFFKPSDGLHTMYTWWFRKCARVLRLTWFLFDERMMDEEGHHVRKSWMGYFRGVKGDPKSPVPIQQTESPFEQNSEIKAYFRRDGRYVRAPASDQVRIPKGGQVFLDVDEGNRTRDGVVDRDDGLHGRNNEMFKMVYIPPYFRWRVFLFMFYIWLFAAGTGVSITIVPLVFGRRIFALLIPAHVQTNDIYAFSIGIYILGSAFYCALHIRDGLAFVRRALQVNMQTPKNMLRLTVNIAVQMSKLVYTYAAFALVLPMLLSLIVEFYFIVPIHSLFFPAEPHVIHVVQSWTLGLLYVKLVSGFILWHADSRPAEALRAVVRNGYFDPDVRIATRCFILPAAVLLSTALAVPLGLAWLSNRYEVFGSSEADQTAVYRYSYLMTLSLAINIFGVWSMIGVLKGWRMRIRDEVYLIGERLHNFGDRTKSGTGSLIPSTTRIET